MRIKTSVILQTLTEIKTVYAWIIREITSQFNFFWVNTHVTHATGATTISLSVENSSLSRLRHYTIAALPLTRKELYHVLIFKMAHKGEKKRKQQKKKQTPQCSLNVSNIFPIFLSLKYVVNTYCIIDNCTYTGVGSKHTCDNYSSGKAGWTIYWNTQMAWLKSRVTGQKEILSSDFSTECRFKKKGSEWAK